MKRLLLLVTLLVPPLAPAAPSTQRVYVVQQLEIGIHQLPDADSPILALVESGAPLDVIERIAGAAHVTTADGVDGWIDDDYLTTDAPPRVQDAQAQVAADAAAAEIARLKGALADAETAVEAAESRAEAAEQLQAERVRAAQETAEATSDTLRELQRIAEENQRLKQHIAEVDALAAMSAERRPVATVAPVIDADLRVPVPRGRLAVWLGATPYAVLASWEQWVWLLLGFALLLASGFGAWLVDWRLRRRHGGFRL